MQWKDIVTGVGLVLVIAGWLFSRWKDRNHEIFKERLKRRLDMCDSVVVLYNAFRTPDTNGCVTMSSPEMIEKLRSAKTKIQLYEYSDEIREYESFLSSIDKNNSENINKSVKYLIEMITTKVRKELGY